MSSQSTKGDQEQDLDEEAQTEPGVNTSEPETPSTSTDTSDTKASVAANQQPQVNLGRMPISIVPKHVRSDSPTSTALKSTPKESHSHSHQNVLTEKALSSTQSLVSTLASQPQPQIILPKLPHQVQSRQNTTHDESGAPSSSKQSESISSPHTHSSPSRTFQSSPAQNETEDLISPKQEMVSPGPSLLPSQSHVPVSSPIDSQKPTTPIVRIKGIVSGQPHLVESPPTADKMGMTPIQGGAKKRRGERGPDKNPNIDPRTGKRRYIKRKNKRFGIGFDLGDLDFIKKDKKKKSSLSKYYPGTSEFSTNSKKRAHKIRKHQFRDQDRHNRHQRHSSHKYSSEQYITPWSREEESDAESLQSSQEDMSERVDIMDSVWRPTDDLRLIMNVLQVNDLRDVLLGTKFSSYYSLEEIESRWDYLLFDDSMCKVSQNAIRNLPGSLKYDVCSKALFSSKENALLQDIESTSDPKQLLPVMKKLIDDNPLVFLKWRTPQHLTRQWMHLRDFHLLCDQDVRDYFEQHNFEDFEGTVNDCDLYPLPYVDEAVLQEKLIHKRMCKKRIRKLEREVAHWQAVAEKSIPGIRPVFEKDAYAMLRGKAVSYFMKHKEITFGRRTDSDGDKKIDADFTLEGSVYKISRTQGLISLRDNGEFIILNQGKHTIYVDGRPLYPHSPGTLRDHSVIEVSLLSFVFLLNHELLRQEAEKMKLEKAMKMESVIFGSIPRSMFSTPSLYLPPHISSHLSSSLSSSILTHSSLSNTLQPLSAIGNRRMLGPNNSPLTSDKVTTAITGSSDLATDTLKPLGMTSPTFRGSMLNTSMFTRPSWYLESTRSEPPPLTTTRISSPMMNTLPVPNYQGDLDLTSPYGRSLSLAYSSLSSTTQTSPTKSLPALLARADPVTRVTTTTSLVSSTSSALETSSSPATPNPQSDLTPAAEALATTTANSLQFGDLTIRPGVPPTSETTSLSS